VIGENRVDSLDKLCLCSDLWQLSISQKQCSVMSIGCRKNDDSFKLFGQTVQSVNTARDLGVQFCCNLTFTSHINKIVAKAHARANLIHKCFLSKDATTLTKAFVTYVRHPGVCICYKVAISSRRDRKTRICSKTVHKAPCWIA